MANVVEKIFKLIFNFGDSEEKIPKMNKLLQTLNARLQNILKTINDIGKADGLQKAADVMGVYTLTVDKAEKAKKKLVATNREENTQNSEAAKYIEDLKNKYGNLIFTKRQVTTLSTNYTTLLRAEKGSVEELQAKVNILNTVWKKMGDTQRNSTAGKQVTAELKQMRNEIRQLTVGAGDYTKNIGNYFSGMYNSVTKSITAVTGVIFTLKQVLWSTFAPFQDLEYRMSMVKAVSQATEEQFAALTKNARDLGAATEYTATEVAGLQLTYARMGFVPEQILKITGATLDLATATGEDLAKSADVVGVTLRGFNLDAGQTQRVVDVMTQSFNSSSLQLESFYEAIKMVAPIATEANVSLEQTVAMLGVLADRGIRGSMAGTALRQIFSEIAKEGGDVNKRLETLSKTGLTLGDAYDEVGQRAMAALTILVKSKSGVDDLTESLQNAEGAANTAADNIRDTMKIDVAVFLSAIEEKLIAIGEALAPVARNVIQFGTWAVTNLKQIIIFLGTYLGAVKLLAAGKTAYLVISGKVAATDTAWGKILMVNVATLRSASAATQLLAAAKLLLSGNIKGATTAFKLFTRSLLANPFGLIATALAGVIAYFVAFRREASSTSDAYSQSTEDINKETKALNDLKDAVAASEDGSVRRRDLINEINEKYGQYLPNLLTEKSTQEDIITALDGVNKKLEENIRLKYASQIADEESKKIVEAEAKLVDDIKALWEKANKGRQMSVETELRIVETAREYTNASKQLIENVANGVEDAMMQQVRSYTSFLDVMRDELGLAGNGFIIAALEANKVVNNAAQRLYQANSIIANNPQDTTTTTDTGRGVGSGKEKGEWSLTKDKEHNRQLIALKKQLYDGQIESEELYQKKVRELEIDTLTKRIALNKDESKVILKIRNELWDKQLQQRKDATKENEAYTANRKTQTEKELKYENDRIDAEIAAMKDGVEKRIKLNDQATKKAQESAAKEYQAEIDKLNKEQKAYAKGSEQYKEIEAEKLNLAFDYELKREDIVTAGVNARVKILQDATKIELKEYDKLPGAAAEAEAAITENKKREIAKRLLAVQEATAEAIEKAEAAYQLDERIADEVLGKGRLRNVERLKNDVAVRNAKAQAYQAELKLIEEAGQADSERYQELLRLLGQVQTEATNIGKGKNADGTRKGFWQMLTELTDEDIAQIKQQALDLAQQTSDAIFNAQQQASQRRLKSEKKAIEAQYNVESKLLDSKRDKGLISEKKYQQELEKLEAKKAEQEEKADREAFEREKKLNIKQALMNTALGVAKALAMYAWPWSLIPAAFAAAQGAIQVATIKSQKYAKGGIIPLKNVRPSVGYPVHDDNPNNDNNFVPIGDGMGVVKGRSHAQGGHQIFLDGRPIGEVEGDELLAIVNKHDTARIGALSAANKVHGKKFAQGGIVSPTSYMTSSASGPVSFYQSSTQAGEVSQYDFAEIVGLLRDGIQATNDRLDRIQVILVAQEVTDMQNDIKKIQTKSSW